ncbi:MAG: radical SAM protein [Myxococcales bacterium FL481]|nr:MAG: radical SAM protein [Myxococcales bacterium FL481]
MPLARGTRRDRETDRVVAAASHCQSERVVALRVAHQVRLTQAEGPGSRYAVWVSGCSLRCPGCCNPQLFEPRAGVSWAVADLVRAVERQAGRSDLDGITILGGEPLEQLSGTAELCDGVAALGLGVIVFTGLTLAQARLKPGFGRLWSAIDTLVDGPFLATRAYAEPTSSHHPPLSRYLGSDNQRLYHRTPRYADPRLWRGAQGAELQISPTGELSAHGHPRAVQKLLRTLRSPPQTGRDRRREPAT